MAKTAAEWKAWAERLADRADLLCNAIERRGSGCLPDSGRMHYFNLSFAVEQFAAECAKETQVHAAGDSK